MSEPNNLALLNEQYHNLITSRKTALIATATSSGIPDISYAPFARDNEGHFYIFVSELAQHTLNIVSNPLISILFIRDETECNNLFARERVVLHASAREIGRSDSRYRLNLEQMQDNFGGIIELLASLNDFHLFELQVESGRYIAGFGRAYQIDISSDSIGNLIQGK